MSKPIPIHFGLVLLAIFVVTLQAQVPQSPLGWASMNGGTTGGAGGTIVTVNNMASFQTQASSAGARIIYVAAGTYTGRVSVSSNKTIYGFPGARIVGGMDINNANNVIVRNLIIEGPGAVDVDGVDCMTISGSTNVWLDHLELLDGQDGNQDIINGSNYITVSWNRFRYTSRSQNHQFSNLVGNSDSRTTDRGRLKVTFHNNWWDAGVRERMPRVRFGQVHIVNNLFNSPDASHCVRAGLEADLLVEGNLFIGVARPIDLFGGQTAVTVRNNVFSGTSGNTSGVGTAFTPPYAFTVAPTSGLEPVIRAGAGATLPAPGSPVSSSSVVVSSSSVPSSSSALSSSVVVSSSSVRSSSSALSSSVVVSSSSVPSSSSALSSSVVVSSSSVRSSSSALSSSVAISSSSSQSVPTMHLQVQGEDFCTAQGVRESSNANFTGQGYLNFDNADGSSAVWRVSIASAQQTNLVLRYANGSAADRPLRIDVNGVARVTSLSFPGTGAWTSWLHVITQIPLQAGTNEIRLVSLTAVGGPNVDLLGFTNQLVQTAPCVDNTTPILLLSEDEAKDREFLQLRGNSLIWGDKIWRDLRGKRVD